MSEITKKRAFGYMLLDLCPRKPEAIRIRDNLTFEGEDVFVYVTV